MTARSDDFEIVYGASPYGVVHALRKVRGRRMLVTLCGAEWGDHWSPIQSESQVNPRYHAACDICRAIDEADES